MVTEDVFTVIKSLVKNRCKDKPYNFLSFQPFAFNLFFQFFNFFHLHVGSKSMVMFVLIGAKKTLVRELEIRFLTHGVMDVLGILYPQY